MEKDFGDAVLKLEMIDGDLVISGALNSKGVGASLSLRADSDYFLTKLAELIPGDSIAEKIALEAVKVALKGAKV